MKKSKTIKALIIIFAIVALIFAVRFAITCYVDDNLVSEELYWNYETISVPDYPSHDVTVVGEQIWAFDKPGDGKDGHEFKVYDMDFNLVHIGDVELYYQNKDGTESSLEMKSVDFNEKNEELLVGNGSSSYTENDSYLFVFYDASKWIDSGDIIDFSNCGTFTCIDVTELGVKSYAFWGESNLFHEYVYVSVNYFEDIYKIELQKGSKRGDFGIYSFIDKDSYNGTYEVYGHWHHTSEVINADGEIVQDGTDEFSAHGGQFWKGYLYLASNNVNRNLIYRCKFKNNGELIFDEIFLEKYNDNNILEYQYIDGLCITDGYIFCSPLINDGNYNHGEDKVILKAIIEN